METAWKAVHIGRRLQGAVSGTIDGDRVRLRSSLPHEGTQLAYRFDGRVQGQTIEGEVDLGEYGTARWTARRVGLAARGESPAPAECSWSFTTGCQGS